MPHTIKVTEMWLELRGCVSAGCISGISKDYIINLNINEQASYHFLGVFPPEKRIKSSPSGFCPLWMQEQQWPCFYGWIFKLSLSQVWALLPEQRQQLGEVKGWVHKCFSIDRWSTALFHPLLPKSITGLYCAPSGKCLCPKVVSYKIPRILKQRPLRSAYQASGLGPSAFHTSCFSTPIAVLTNRQQHPQFLVKEIET